MECPVCGEKSYPVATVRGTTTLFGAGAGGYVAATAGGQTGATIGTLLCPGVGTLIGGALGILVGAAGGAVAGNTVGPISGGCDDETLSRLQLHAGDPVGRRLSLLFLRLRIRLASH